MTRFPSEIAEMKLILDLLRLLPGNTSLVPEGMLHRG